MTRLANGAVARMGRSANAGESHAITRGKGDRLALLALLALCACGQPDRLVIDDDPELVDAVMVALTDLEHEAGCKLFERIEIGGSGRDWKGPLPPNGTVTVQVAPGQVPGSDSAYTRNGITQGRARISFRTSSPARTLAAHELGHALGLEHREGGGLMAKHVMNWSFGPELLEDLRARCVDGPAGPDLPPL